MKYLKEGKWEDFISELKNLNNRRNEIENQLNLQIKKDREKRKEIVNQYREEIEICMIDLEDYLSYKTHETYGDNNIDYIFSYSVHFDSLQVVKDVIEKLNSYIGQESYEIQLFNENANTHTGLRNRRYESIEHIENLVKARGERPLSYKILFKFKKLR